MKHNEDGFIYNDGYGDEDSQVDTPPSIVECCLGCGGKLNYFMDGDYCYCPKCNDRAYYEDGFIRMF